MNLREIILQPVATTDEARFQSLMPAHHYLGSLPKIGHTLRYVATWRDEWLALMNFSAVRGSALRAIPGSGGISAFSTTGCT